ncbi:MAG: division/cell wall cluster transcriptional repressor MraZ [Legionellales bacterium]|jgi:MraZ protein|nr:division/cell wall cluster transcriptional repressor MraZ [Legionellales bacterium]
MYKGINNINVDAKGRMAIPARYRACIESQAASKMVVTIDTEDKCLLLYDVSEWEKIEKKISALPSFNKATRRIQRLLIGHATDVELDSQGRILLPLQLRHYANVDKKVTLIGQGNKFEIWSSDVWQQSCDVWLQEEASGNGSLPDELSSISV